MIESSRKWESWHKVSDFPPEHGEFVWIAHAGWPDEKPYIAKRSYDINTVDKDQ